MTKAPAAKKHTAQARAMPATLPRAVVPTRSAASPTDAQIIERLRKELATKDAEIAALRAELTASRAAATVQLVPATKESPTVIALSASQLNREGMAAMSAGNYPVAVDKFRRAADLNDVAAIANLGTMYLNGSGVARDPFQALQLLVRAANGGNRTAAENLGTLSEYGIGGVAQNPVRAYQWYQVAARLGSVTVQTSMARIRAQGN
ncbi:hypothetical protein RhoFW510R10_11745 [Rhodanobacter sp. FW510-R10]|nr:hypothetical protein RhoFW510R10_11745 [Rhodanobacter sp. FW510-R10]